MEQDNIQIVWIAYLGRKGWDFALCMFFILVALFGCYANISFMCPLFRHRTEHLRIPSVRFIFHVSLSDFFFGAFTAVFLVLHVIVPLGFSVQYILFYLFPYLTFVVDLLVILIALEHFSEVCSEDYDRDIRIRDCRRQPLVVWLVPVFIVVAVLLTPFDPTGLGFLFPAVTMVVFLVTFGATFAYIFVIRRMNLDLHRQGLMEHTRLRLLQRNRLILVHLTMTIVFVAFQSVGVLFLIFYTNKGMRNERPAWCIAAGTLGLLNSVIKPIIYVVGTQFYRDVFTRKDAVVGDAERVAEEDS